MKMSDALHVEDGFLPWLPGHSVDAGEVLDYHNVPRVGLLHQSGLTYYFECIIGDGQDLGLWAYSLLTEEEIMKLLTLHGPEQFDDFTPQLLQHRWVTVAMAVEDTIVDSSIFDVEDENAVSLANRMLRHWERQQEARDGAAKILESLPA